MVLRLSQIYALKKNAIPSPCALPCYISMPSHYPADLPCYISITLQTFPATSPYHPITLQTFPAIPCNTSLYSHAVSLHSLVKFTVPVFPLTNSFPAAAGAYIVPYTAPTHVCLLLIPCEATSFNFIGKQSLYYPAEFPYNNYPAALPCYISLYYPAVIPSSFPCP